MPRSYSMGKRALQQADTRRRILDATIELYLEQGVSSTTTQDIARRADVAPGTVINHFGSRSALDQEIGSQLLGDLRMPTPDLFDGVDDLDVRIRLMVHDLAVFFARTEPWWRARERETGDVPFWTDAERRFYVDLDALIRAALGPLAGDEDAVAMIMTVLGRWVIGSLQAAGRTSDQAVDLVAEMFNAWLARRADRPA